MTPTDLAEPVAPPASSAALVPTQSQTEPPLNPVSPHRQNPAAGHTAVPFNATWLLTVYLALLLFIPARWVLPGLGAAGRPASIFSIGLLGLWAVIHVLPSIELRRSPLRWLVWFNAVTILVSYAAAFDRGAPSVEALSADRSLLALLGASGLMLMVSEGLPTGADLERLVRRLIQMTTVIAVVGVVQFFFRIDPFANVRFPGLVLNREISDLGQRGTNSFVRVKGSMGHAIEFSVVMAMMLPLAVHQYIKATLPASKRRWLAVAGLHFVAINLAVSRSGIVALAAALVVLVWAWSPRFRLQVAVVGVFALGAMRVAIPGLLGTIASLFENIGNDASVRGRTQDYEIAARFIRERPWFGRGRGTFLPSEYIVLDNAYLGRLISTGFVGLAAMILLLVGGMFLARRAIRRLPTNTARHLAVGVWAAILAAALAAGTFDLNGFAAADGLLLIATGLSAALFTAGDDFEQPAFPPQSVLRAGYRADIGPRPWWFRVNAMLERRASGRSRTIRVAQRPVVDNLETQPYITLLGRTIDSESVAVSELRTTDLIRRRPHIIHLHWPDHVLSRGLRPRIRAFSVLAAIAFVRLRGTLLFYTAHNLTPHAGHDTRFYRWFMRRFDRMVDELIVMSKAGRLDLIAERPQLATVPWHHIRHGHFKELISPVPGRAEARRQLGLEPDRKLVVFVGQVRAYKGVPELIDATVHLDADVLIAGRCVEPELAQELHTAASQDPRLKLFLRYLSNDDLAFVLAAADVVVLPYRRILNSGSTLLAISARRPVVVPATPSFLELASEIGPAWVRTYATGTLKSAIANTLAAPPPTERPNLSAYEWENIAAQTTAAYRLALTRTTQRTSRPDRGIR